MAGWASGATRNEPLHGNARFHHRAAALAFAQRHRVGLHFFQQPQLLQIGHDALPRLPAVQAGVASGVVVHPPLLVHHLHLGQAVALAHLEVVGVMRRGHLDRSGAKLGVGVGVGDQRNFPLHQREQNRLAVKLAVALILRVDGDGRVAQHGLRARGGYDHVLLGAEDRVADVPEAAGLLLVGDFQVRERRLTARAPVDDVAAAVDQLFLVEPDEDFAHGARQPRVQREALARPVAGGAQAAHLAVDGVALLLLPLPYPALELLAAQLYAVQPLLGQLPFHHHLGGDAGVVSARQPEHIASVHPLPADQDVNLGVLQHVAHVERAGHVGRRDHQRKHGPRAGRVGHEQPALDPPLAPPLLNGARVVSFGQLLPHKTPL